MKCYKEDSTRSEILKKKMNWKKSMLLSNQEHLLIYESFHLFTGVYSYLIISYPSYPL